MSKNLQNKKSSTVESFMGKSLMGIFAAILILISLVLFVVTVIPDLDDTAKTIIMYAFSLLALIAGLALFIKDRTNNLYAALCGFGVSAIFVSLTLHYFYFHTISKYLIYALLLAWVALVCVLAQSRSVFFQIIGQAGILISLSFSLYSLSSKDDLMELGMLMVFFCVAELTFVLINIPKSFKLDSPNHVGLLIGLSILSFSFDLMQMMKDNSQVKFVSSIVLIILCVITMVTLFIKVKPALGSCAYFAVITYFLYSNICSLIPAKKDSAIDYLISLFSGDKADLFGVTPLFAIGIAVILLVAIELRFKEKQPGTLLILQIPLMLEIPFNFFKLAICGHFEIFVKHFGLPLFIVALLVLGHCRKRLVYKLSAYVMMGIFAVDFIMSDGARLIYGLALFILFSYILSREEKRELGYEIYLYIIFGVWSLKELVLGFDSLPAYGMSTIAIAISIVLIFIGLASGQKMCRLYGLILSIMSVVKLVLIDVHYKSSATRALSFLICGLLCLLISFIYKRIESSYDDQDTDEQ